MDVGYISAEVFSELYFEQYTVLLFPKNISWFSSYQQQDCLRLVPTFDETVAWMAGQRVNWVVDSTDEEHIIQSLDSSQR